ncbi:MAG: DNA cytosine methyltransferase [Dehalococcoidia bacterium]
MSPPGGARRRHALSLYTGAGGLDLGLEAAGFKVNLCVETDEDCRSTLRSNRRGWQLAEPGNVHELTPKEALRQAELHTGELTLLAGGPPCQPFSKSSYWVNGGARRLNDPRAATLVRYLDFVEAALPQVLLLENVKGLVYNGKDEALRLLQNRLGEINRRHQVAYKVCVVHLNCADYGVPQTRERVFIVADRAGGRFEAPPATHTTPEDAIEGKTEPHRTAWDAIGDLDGDTRPDELTLRGKWGDLLPSIPEGENYLWHTPRGGGKPLFGWRTRFWSFLLKLAKDRPAWTIQAAPGPATGPFHWRNRHLSVAELGRLQTFPDDYEVAGDYRSQHRQIGNAVPPAIGELLGREIRRQLLGGRPHHRAAFVPARREDCPPAYSEEPVPRKYDKYVGDHDDHPGTGKGPGVLRRAEADG